MGNDALEQKLHDLYSSGDIAGAVEQHLAELGSEEMVQEWPQSGERISGRDNILAVNQHYEGATGTAPSLDAPADREARTDAWIVEGTIDYGDGTPVSLVSILEADADGKIIRATGLLREPVRGSRVAAPVGGADGARGREGRLTRQLWVEGASIVSRMSEPTVRTRRRSSSSTTATWRGAWGSGSARRARAWPTQAQLAEGRYTAAYISALERGLAKPSMAALTFLSERLGVSIPDLVAEERPAAGRLEADLLLASGKAAGGAGPYDALLDDGGRGPAQSGGAAAWRGRSALPAHARARGDPAGIRSRGALRRAGRTGRCSLGALLAGRRSLSGGQPGRGAVASSSSCWPADRAGLDVAPDFRFRLLTQLGNVEAWDGESGLAASPTWKRLRSLVDAASLRPARRFLSGLALQYRRAWGSRALDPRGSREPRALSGRRRGARRSRPREQHRHHVHRAREPGSGGGAPGACATAC